MYSNVQVLDATAQKVYCARVVLVRDSSLSSKAYGWHPLVVNPKNAETPQLARLRIIWIPNRKSAISKFESAQLREKLTKGRIIHLKSLLSQIMLIRVLSRYLRCVVLSLMSCCAMTITTAAVYGHF